MLNKDMTLAPVNTTNVDDVTGLQAYNQQELTLEGEDWANFVTYLQEFGGYFKKNNGARLMDLFAKDYYDALEHCRQLGLDALQIHEIWDGCRTEADDGRFDDPAFWIFLTRDLDC